MTANELADGILAIEERIFLTKKEHQLFQNSATMLRQQQAEIEMLKSELNRFQERYNELLADFKIENFSNDAYDNIFANGKRLGVIETENKIWKAMNLSNEEIGLLTTDPRFSHVESPLLLDFARAILRKAQEK